MSKRITNIIPSENSILYIDIGNTSIKAAYKDGVQWKYPGREKLRTASDLVEWANQHQKEFELTVVCSVVPDITNAIREGLNSNRIRVFSAEDIPEDLILYETPGTLGIDRFFACYGALSYTPKAVVVIDAGTACTIDYMTPDSVFVGGVIMPGIGILEKALKEQAPELPSVGRHLPEVWPGRSTRTSLQWGLSGAFKDSLEAALDRYEEQFEEFELNITGGDAQWISQVVDRESKVRPNLIFEGIYRYLEDYL